MEVVRFTDGGTSHETWELPDAGWDDWAAACGSIPGPCDSGHRGRVRRRSVQWLEINYWQGSGRLIAFPSQDGPHGDRGERVCFELSSEHLGAEAQRVSESVPEAEQDRAWEARLPASGIASVNALPEGKPLTNWPPHVSRTRCALPVTITTLVRGRSTLTRAGIRLTSLMASPVKSAPSTGRGRGSAPDGVPVGLGSRLGSGLARRGDGRLRQVAMRGRPPAASARKPLSGVGTRATLGGDARVVGRRGDRPGPAHAPDALPRPARRPLNDDWLTQYACPVRLRLGGGADGPGPIGGGPIGVGGSTDVPPGPGRAGPSSRRGRGGDAAGDGRGLLPEEAPRGRSPGAARSAPRAGLR